METIKVFTAFSGYDSQMMALNRVAERHKGEIDFDLVGWSEIDKYAIKAHDLIFPEYKDRNYGDISKIDWSNVPDFDLFTYSSPCFVAGTLIHTEDGFKPIEDVKNGDKVLSHDNQYHTVEKIGHKPSDDIYRVIGSMLDEVICTGEHPFYTREKYRYGHKSERRFRQPQWTAAKDLNMNTYLGYAINTKSELPHWDGSVDNRYGKWFRIRKLTPRECFRLMDVEEHYIDAMIVEYVDAKGRTKQVISNSQLYKLAGNSIVTSCMYYIFLNLFYPEASMGKQEIQLSLF